MSDSPIRTSHSKAQTFDMQNATGVTKATSVFFML